ncbi:PEP-CTERM sorting domain-containing protein [Aeoliella sp. SH292]|uniref:PEP-CTERM sorting domain-containing protein n=1 Tax=Aeoliella sp. SH292 TaxID=3454464 RepID=UPI003F9545D0
MNYRTLSLSFALCMALAGCQFATSHAAGFLSPDDFIIAIDTDGPQSDSGYPGAESPNLLLDGTPDTKYLNFGGRGTGFIVMPGPSVAQSFQLWTANDADWRDPTSYQIYGTNQPIASTDNSDGLGETWNLIAEGGLDLPFDRFAPGGVVSFTNAQSYSSYKMVFPTMRWPDDAIQLGEAQIYGTSTGTSPLLNSGTPVLGIHNREFDSAYFAPDNNPWGIDEGPQYILDGSPNTKLLNFGWKNTGFIVTPDAGATSISGFRITTANDADGRDPTSWQLYGTNSAITSEDNSRGDTESWTLIQSGDMNLPFERGKLSDVIPVSNSAGAFTSYKMVFPTTRTTDGGLNGNSSQIADIEFFQGALPTTDPITLRVNPQTGMMSIVSTVNFTISNYQIVSGVGALQFENWNSITEGDRDPDNEWFSEGESRYFIGERLADGEEGGLQLMAGVPFDLGQIWMPVPIPDLSFTVFTDQGAIQANGVEWTTGAPITLPGDFDMSGGPLTIADWTIFRSIWGSSNFEGLSRAEGYLNGDMDGDFDSDLDDFNLFLNIAGARGGFLSGSVVPEPASVVTLGLLAGLLVVRRGFSRRGLALVMGVVGAACFSTSASALTFTNPYGVPVAYSSNTAAQDANTGVEQLFDNFYLEEPGEFPLEINARNFADVQFGEFEQWGTTSTSPTIFLDYGAQINPNWFAYAQRHEDGNFNSDRVGKFEFWFSNSPFNDTVPTRTPDSVYEFPGSDNRVNGSLLRSLPLEGEFNFRYAAVRFNLQPGSPEPHNVGGHEFRFIEGPSNLVLEINRGTGAMTLRNNGAPGDTAAPEDIDIRGYAIRSESGAFNAAGFNGLGGNPGFPEGNLMGSGWEVGGGSDEGQLVEGYFGMPFQGVSSTITAGTTGLALGNAYDIYSLAEDVKFAWTDRNGFTLDGRVVYVGTAPEGVPGDYNGDGTVNLADYTVWRDTLGATGTGLAADGNSDNVVNAADYGIWKGNFGSGSGSVAAVGTSAVPEPSTVLIAAAGLLAVTAIRRRV